MSNATFQAVSHSLATQNIHAYVATGLTQLMRTTPKIIVGVIVFLLFWVIAVIAKWSITRLADKRRRRYLYRLIGSTLKVIILVIGAITSLGTMGLNVTALVTGAGLSGFAVGIAMKDPLSNILSGFMVLFYEPFQINDDIVVGTNEGKVIDINLRYTVLKTDVQKILIPNVMMLTSALIIKNSA